MTLVAAQAECSSAGVSETISNTQLMDLDAIGEHLSTIRLCERDALAAMRRSLEEHGQLSALVLFSSAERLEIIDGFKRMRAARSLGWTKLWVRVLAVGSIDAKIRLRELHDGRGLTELEEAWLVRSLYREDHLSLPDIATRLSRHRSWVWRRLMLVEALEPGVQSDVRLGLIAARAAVTVSRLPRGNQAAAAAVVTRRGLTVRQTELLVEEVLLEPDPARRQVLIAHRLEGPAPQRPPGPRPTRTTRTEAEWMSADILRVRDLAARLEARLLGTPLEVFTPTAAELMRDALVGLSPVLRALDDVIGRVTDKEAA